MLLELGIAGAASAGALYLGRNTAPVKYVGGWFKGVVTRSRLGQSFLLNNAKDNITKNLDIEKDKLKTDVVEIEAQRKDLAKKKDHAEFLEYLISSDEVDDKDKEHYKYELENKLAEIKTLESAIATESSLLGAREQALDSYERDVINKQLADADLAKTMFDSQNKIEKLEKDLNKVRNLGESTMTAQVISRYTTVSSGTTTTSAKYGHLMEDFRKSKDD